MKTFEIWIENDRWNKQVKIYMRMLVGGEWHSIYNLENDGLATAQKIEGCSTIPTPYLTFPDDHWDAIKKELFSENENRLKEELIKLKGEVTAKEKHIENLNEIFEKTLNKISLP